MYLHLTQKDKAQAKDLLIKHDEILSSLDELHTTYEDISVVLINQFPKLLKKSRLNVPENKEIFMLQFIDKDSSVKIIVKHEPKDGIPYLHTNVQEQSFEFGSSNTDTYDRIDVVESSTLILRVLYKLSEVILKSMRRYETDETELAEIAELSESVGIGRELSQVDVLDILQTAENRLDSIFILGRNSKQDVRVENVTHELSLLDTYKKYRSDKEIVEIETNFYGHKITDRLTIEKNEISGKFHYTLSLTKIDKLKDGTYDIILVNTSLEVSQASYTTVLTDHLNALLTTAESRLEELKIA